MPAGLSWKSLPHSGTAIFDLFLELGDYILQLGDYSLHASVLGNASQTNKQTKSSTQCKNR